VYEAGCPFKPGDRISLGTVFGGQLVVYAGMLIRAVTEMSFSARSGRSKEMDRLARAEGFADSQVWTHNFRIVHRDVLPGTTVHRYLFDEMKLSPEISDVKQVHDPSTTPDDAEFDDGGGFEPESKVLGNVSNLDDLAGVGG